MYICIYIYIYTYYTYCNNTNYNDTNKLNNTIHTLTILYNTNHNTTIQQQL